ncbi:MAG TPA: hypothetical protein VII56_00605 [Rhizomicrobium sp.]
MRMTVRVGAALLAAGAMTANAQGAACIAPADMAALRLAALQQNLMVAGYSCQEARSYNRFVISHRGELMASDAQLKSFFVQRSGRGGAGYDLFKTELANAASLRSIHDPEGFCAGAEDAFTWARDADQLSGASDDLPTTIAVGYRSCTPEGPREARNGEETPGTVSWTHAHHAAIADSDDTAPAGRRHHEMNLDDE